MEKDEDIVMFHPDSMYCRRIFPIETWDVITRKLKKFPKVLENLSNSSPFFRHLLAYQRPNFLLEKVLTFVVPTIWKNDFEAVVMYDKEESLPLKEFLKCRQLNSHWNHVVDKLFIENFKLSEDDNDNKIDSEIQSMVRYNFSCLYTPTKLLTFLDHFQLTHSGRLRSPFICPELSVHTHTLSRHIHQDEQLFLERMSILLQKYGLHVRKFNLDIEGAAFIRETNILQCWLRQMKNLKSLKIECDNMARVARRLAKIKIPKFNQLEYLETSKLPAPLFNKLINQNRHISSLNIRTSEENYNFAHPTIELCTFANLKTLKMYIDHRLIFDKLVSPLVQFPVVIQLTLRFTVLVEIRWSEIFKMVQNKFGKTVEYMFLELVSGSGKIMKAQNYQDSLFYRLVLPKLKEISLVLWNHTSLDFLLPVKDTLEIIELEIKYSEKDEIKMSIYSIVQLYGFEKKIWASNIPYLFTSLKKIGICKEGGKCQWYSRMELIDLRQQ